MTARGDGFLEMRVADLERRLASILRIGTVAELDEAESLARVQVGELLLDWLPWAQRRLGDAREYWAPVVGEQVMVLSPGGDSRLGVITLSLASDAFPLPASSAALHRVEYADGSSVEFDGNAGTFAVVATGDVTVAADGDVTVDAGGKIAATAGGDITVDAGGKLAGSAATTAEISAGASMKLSAPSITLDSPSISLGGTVSVTGPLSGPSAAFSAAVTAGAATVSGAFTAGAATISGALTAPGAVTLGPLTTIGGSLYRTHVHVSAGPGLPTTPPAV